jgi:hypothetical protein
LSGSTAPSGRDRRPAYDKSSACDPEGLAPAESDAGLASGMTCAAPIIVPSPTGPRSAWTPRPTSTPNRNMTPQITPAAINTKTSCFPFRCTPRVVSSVIVVPVVCLRAGSECP